MAPQPAATHSSHWAAGRKSQTDAQELHQGQHQIVGEPRAERSKSNNSNPPKQ